MRPGEPLVLVGLDSHVPRGRGPQYYLCMLQ
jgi:hypothetical protein